MKGLTKAIKAIKARIQTLIKLVAFCRKYVIDLLDLEEKLAALLKLQLLPTTTKRKVVIFSTETNQITFVGSYEQFQFAIRNYPKKLKAKLKAAWVNMTTSQIIQEIPIT